MAIVLESSQLQGTRNKAFILPSLAKGEGWAPVREKWGSKVLTARKTSGWQCRADTTRCREGSTCITWSCQDEVLWPGAHLCRVMSAWPVLDRTVWEATLKHILKINPDFFFYFVCFYLLFVLWDKVSYISGWPWTPYLSAFTFWMLELKLPSPICFCFYGSNGGYFDTGSHY